MKNNDKLKFIREKVIYRNHWFLEIEFDNFYDATTENPVDLIDFFIPSLSIGGWILLK